MSAKDVTVVVRLLSRQDGTDRAREMRCEREREIEEIECVSLFRTLTSQSRTQGERRGDEAHESVFVASRQSIPELVVAIHLLCNLYRDRVQPVTSALVDQKLTRLDLPALDRITRYIEQPPYRVRG